MGTESFVLENFRGAVSLFPGAHQDEGRKTLLHLFKIQPFPMFQKFVYKAMAGSLC
jgi:hypothetical protein